MLLQINEIDGGHLENLDDRRLSRYQQSGHKKKRLAFAKRLEERKIYV